MAIITSLLLHPEKQSKLLVTKLSAETTIESLKAHFAQHGEIERCHVSMGPTGNCTGIGIITYASQESCEAAARAGPCMLHGQEVHPRQAVYAVANWKKIEKFPKPFEVMREQIGNVVIPSKYFQNK
ncbi:hypothetical protein JTE90_029661 [Oedothorax gibbosus]|uniref:RRM domain-containing protein n=1 Tax=Oedothorax gibbosus TaxID=931172 RepID=A0AAV6VF11_9ARAC|nr:hypothetical protein JTE90_029661 [Oedothorax gibbosus]